MKTSTMLGLVFALLAGGAMAQDAAQRGRRLFFGEVPMAGHIKGNDMTLPSTASKCANCHLEGTAVPSPSASATTRSFGPPLNAETLTREIRRRNGPPSRYSAEALCQALNTGVDPAYIVIARTMPRYEASMSQCRDLWAYLSGERP